MHREISWRVAASSLGQVALFFVAMAAAVLGGVPWASFFGVLLLGAVAVWMTVLERGNRWTEAFGWAGTLLAWALLFLGREDIPRFGVLHMVAGLSVAVGVLTSGEWFMDEARRQRWRIMGLAWGGAASWGLLAGGYSRSQFILFHGALASFLVLLIACRVLLRLNGVMIQVVHTLILLVIGLPLVDAFMRPSYQLDDRPEVGKQFYSFKAAQQDPGAFSSWWYHFLKQWEGLHEAVSMPDPDGLLRYRLRPNTEARIFESTIRINSLGFRGPEIERAKGDAYRIVALGESTTFGCTISDDGTPWPRMLEALLRERLQPSRPVQVINAGVYGYTLEENMRRLKRILALKPDMIISYHGYNWFSSLTDAVPSPQGEAPPQYTMRPLKLLADFEYQLRVRYHRWKRIPPQVVVDLEPEALMETPYAEAYRELIRTAREHDIRLVIANYSMAVNGRSEPEVVEFYRAGFPEVRASIRANEMHTEILHQLAVGNPDVCWVDTHPRMDGFNEKYIDLTHFTQPGRQEMAEIFYEAIHDIVETDAQGNGEETRLMASEKEKTRDGAVTVQLTEPNAAGRTH